MSRAQGRNFRVSKGKRKITMMRALYSAASGMSAQELNLDTIANNL